MRNPAWRPAQLHTERLGSIQHHFIDGGNAGRNAAQQGAVHTLPVCMAIVPEHPADALQPHKLVAALTRELNRQSSTTADRAGWQLEDIPPEGVATHAAEGFMLVYATADLDGVRLAYSMIKRLSVTPTRRYAVLFGGARDQGQVQRCQQRLASGTRRFLGIDLHELGHLPASGPEFIVNLTCVAEQIRQLYSSQSTPDTREITHP